MNVLADEFELANQPELFPRYNIAPTQEVPVVVQEDGRRTLAMMQWGLVPSWAKDAKGAARMINARAETVHEKPAFRAAFKRRRCLIPADGYYEWKAAGKKKQPYLVHQQDDRPFAFAGLWEIWRGPKDAAREEPLLSCSIITTDAAPSVRQVHDRMPVVLPKECFAFWLDAEFEDQARLREMLVPWDFGGLQVDPVSTHVNNVRNQDSSCVVPIDLAG